MKKILFIFLIIPISAFADQLILSNITKGCSSELNQPTYLKATFTQNQYQCASGYYVPANNDGCVVCPDVYDCNGGNFTFNEEYDQGNKFKVQVTENIRNGCKEDFLRAYNNVSNITATFTPNIHNCNPGYYLPANIDECRKCLNDHYCPGGQLTFNETTPQGINPCPSAHPFAPAGMWLESQCGRKLHLGDYIMYMHQSPAHPTEHRLYTRVNGNIYSANMSLSDTPMNIQTERKLKVSFGNNTYCVFDDSMESNQ